MKWGQVHEVKVNFSMLICGHCNGQIHAAYYILAIKNSRQKFKKVTLKQTNLQM